MIIKLTIAFVLLTSMVLFLQNCNLPNGKIHFKGIILEESYSCSMINNGDSGVLYIDSYKNGVVIWNDGSYMYGKVENPSVELQKSSNIRGLQISGQWILCSPSRRDSIEYWFRYNCNIARLKRLVDGKVVYDSGIILNF